MIYKIQSKHIATEEIGDSSSQRIVRVFFGVLILFVTINFLANWYLDSYTNKRSHWLLKTKWSMLLDETQSVDWLVLGDSSGNQGVNTQMLQKRMGGRALNLCTIGNSLIVGDLWMLETLIKKQLIPVNIILVHVYDVWMREDYTPYVLAMTPLSYGFWENYSFDSGIGGQKYFEILLQKYIPLYSQNETLSSRLRSPLTLTQQILSIDETGFMRMTQANPEFVVRDYNWHISNLQQRGEKIISDINKRAYKALVKIVVDNKINLYVVHAPIYSALADSLIFQDHNYRLNTELKKLSGKNTNISILPDVKGFAKENLESVEHVVGDSAEVYTDFIIQNVIKK